MDLSKHNETSTLTYKGTRTQHNSYQIQKSSVTQGKTRLKICLLYTTLGQVNFLSQNVILMNLVKYMNFNFKK